MPARIPFDSLVMAAVAAELQRWQGARVQKIWQPDAESVVLEIHSGGNTGWLWIGWDAEFPRVYVSPRKPSSMKEPPAFAMALRARIEDKRIERVQQVGFDRILEIQIGDHELIVELMGKHSNAILVGPEGRVVSAGKIVGTRHKRPVVSGRPYEAPPNVVAERDVAAIAQHASPFLKSLFGARSLAPSVRSEGVALEPSAVFKRLEQGVFEPVFVPEAGAYPISVSALGYTEIKRETISIALANFYDLAIPARCLEIERSRLLTQLRRVQLAREVTIADLESAQEAAGRAHIKQRMGELILAYRGQIRLGDRELKAYDYDGSQLVIPLDPELDPIANSNAFFAKAKKAKSRAGLVVEQLARHRADLEILSAVIEQAEGETSLRALEELREQAAAKRWLMVQRLPMEKEDRPFEGKKIREMLGPGGWRILVGENAEANDYLTLRVAKPDDWWLHVRGAVSAHVIIPTQRQPDKVPKQVIDFAAKVAVKHSGQKHASFVPVDITLRRYVRRVKGGAPGTVLYTHERTIHVDAKE